MFDATKQGQRIEQLRKSLKIDKKVFSKIIGYTSQTNYDTLARGGRNISSKILFKLSEYSKEINLHWLLTGDGEMFFCDNENLGAIAKGAESSDINVVKSELSNLSRKMDLLLSQREKQLKTDIKGLQMTKRKMITRMDVRD